MAPVEKAERASTRVPSGLKWAVGMMLVALAIAAGLYPSVEAAREAARRSQCVCNFCMIKSGLHYYHSTFGSFPPAYLADADGKPIHSWRVLILPFMEQQALYDRYRFDEPWDGPNNIKLLDERSSVWACPSDRRMLPGRTNYVALTGPGTAFPGAGVVKIEEITDGTANTLFLAETTTLDVPWTAPVDLDIRSMSFQLNDRARPSISSKHPGGANVVTADGGYRFLKNTANPDDLRALLTIQGGERVDVDAVGDHQNYVHEKK